MFLDPTMTDRQGEDAAKNDQISSSGDVFVFEQLLAELIGSH